MSESDDRFANHVRSASFALTLSAAQIGRMLVMAKVAELRDKYPWYQPRPIDFGTTTDAMAFHTDSTIRSLVRKGLVDVLPLELPCDAYDMVVLTAAGLTTCELLILAGFEASPTSVPSVPPHPDDRIPMVMNASRTDFHLGEPPPDRRYPADPSVAPYLSMLRARTPVRAQS